MYAYIYIKYLYSALQRFECWAFFLQEAWFCCLDFNTPLRFPVRRSDEKRVWAKRVVEDVGENNSRIQEGGRTSAKQLSKWSFPEPVLPPRSEENFPKKGKDPESWKSELGKNQTEGHWTSLVIFCLTWKTWMGQRKRMPPDAVGSNGDLLICQGRCRWETPSGLWKTIERIGFQHLVDSNTGNVEGEGSKSQPKAKSRQREGTNTYNLHHSRVSA